MMERAELGGVKDELQECWGVGQVKEELECHSGIRKAFKWSQDGVRTEFR